MAQQEDEKKDAYIEVPQTIGSSAAALEAAVSTIKGQIAKIAKHIEDCKTSKAKVEESREKLRNHHANGGLSGVIADAFRPDNDKRYGRALEATNDCVKNYSSLGDKLVTLKDKLEKLMVVIKLITTWAKDINALTTSSVLNMVFPELKWPNELMGKAFDGDAFNTALTIVVSIAGGLVAGGILAGGLLGVVGALAGLAVVGVLLLVGGIMKAESDKDLYEDWEKKAKESAKTIQDSIVEVDKSLQNIDDYWSKVGQLLINAKLLDADKKDDQSEILTKITILSNQIAKYSTMWKSFYRHVQADGSNLDEEAKACAEDSGKEGDADTIKMFKLYWYAYSNKYTIDEIKKQMQLTNEEYDQLLAILLLNQGVSPNEVEKRVKGVSKDVIQKVAVALKGSKGG